MQINPSDYQEEKKESFDLSLTKEEKLKLALYFLCIALGIALLLGLFKSGEVVSHQAVVNATILNITQNVTMNITAVWL